MKQTRFVTLIAFIITLLCAGGGASPAAVGGTVQ